MLSLNDYFRFFSVSQFCIRKFSTRVCTFCVRIYVYSIYSHRTLKKWTQTNKAIKLSCKPFSYWYVQVRSDSHDLDISLSWLPCSYKFATFKQKLKHSQLSMWEIESALVLEVSSQYLFFYNSLRTIQKIHQNPLLDPANSQYPDLIEEFCGLWATDYNSITGDIFKHQLIWSEKKNSCFCHQRAFEMI